MTILQRVVATGSSVVLALTIGGGAFAASHPEAAKGPKPALHINARGVVQIHGAEVTGKGDASFTVNIWGTAWTVNVVEKTKFERRKGGVSTVGELSVGDKVNVTGKIIAGALALDARSVRNLSAHDVVLRGTVQTIVPPDTITIKTKGGAVRTVKVMADTKIMFADVVKIFADLAVGEKVIVRGVESTTTDIATAAKIVIKEQAPAAQ